MMLSASRKPTHLAIHAPPAHAAFRPRILCASDLSSKSEHAIARALQLCEALAGRALLLHVISNNVPLRLAGRRADRAQDALQWHARQFAHLNVKPELSVRIGPTHATIARAAQSWGADLVVLGLHRERPANELTWSTAERIAHRVRRPVLVINTEAKRDYSAVTFVAGRDTSLGVQLADQYDLFSAAHLSIVPFLPLKERGTLALARWIESRDAARAKELRTSVDRSVQQAIEDAGLHRMGVELIGGHTTPRALMARIRKGKRPQLLVAGLSRNPLRLRSLARLSALSALRTRVCDVLVFPEASARGTLHAPAFTAQSVAGT
ncbi:MAG: universal stress protein [Xanthomonadaceae bacterium]|nr:universal stress protein [Xanthomonadaceae bacterium]